MSGRIATRGFSVIVPRKGTEGPRNRRTGDEVPESEFITALSFCNHVAWGFGILADKE